LKQIQDENIDYLFFDSFKNTSKYFCYYVWGGLMLLFIIIT